MKYHIEIYPYPKAGFENCNSCRDLYWRWEIREILSVDEPNPAVTNLGPVLAGGAEETIAKAQQLAENWAQAYSDKLSYVYTPNTGKSDK